MFTWFSTCFHSKIFINYCQVAETVEMMKFTDQSFRPPPNMDHTTSAAKAAQDMR